MRWLEETHSVQFELVRHFLQRMFDGEWSSSPGQWRSAAIGAFALLVPAGLLLIREGTLDPEYPSKYRLLAMAGPAAIRASAIADELALITLVSCVGLRAREAGIHVLAGHISAAPRDVLPQLAKLHLAVLLGRTDPAVDRRPCASAFRR